MLGLISLRFFAQSGHIDAFRSIVGEARGGEKTSVAEKFSDTTARGLMVDRQNKLRFPHRRY
jgi:hypothetical protein